MITTNQIMCTRHGKVSKGGRRQRPAEFPYVCTLCPKEPRFRMQEDLQKHKYMKHGIGLGSRKIRSKVSHSMRRERPEEFPEVCDRCKPIRRFKRPTDLGNHNRSKHGSIIESSKPPRHELVESITSKISRISFPSSLHSAPQISSRHGSLYGIYASASSINTQTGRRDDQFYGQSLFPPNLSSASRFPSFAAVPMSSKPSSPLDRKMTSTELNTFVASTIEPDSAYKMSCSAVVDRLVHFLQNNMPYDLRPQEVIKGGSLGKGTAVKNRSDADLIVFLSNSRYNSIGKMMNEMSNVQRLFRRYLGDYGECQITDETEYAVKVKLSCHSGHDVDVDILPTCNILEFKEPREIYEEMRQKSDKERKYYSVPLVKLQMEFVKGKIDNVTKLKTLIRTVKFWRKTAFQESSSRRLPSSYPLELITIGEWENAGRPSNFDLRKGFYNVLNALRNHHTFRKVWTDNYQMTMLPPKPYVMDPADPFNNVMDASDSWKEVAERAERTLSSGFHDLHGNISWQ